MNEVNKNITSSLYNLYYEANTFSSNITENVSIQDESFPGDYQRNITSIKPEDGAKKKKVYCYISSKVCILVCTLVVALPFSWFFVVETISFRERSLFLTQKIVETGDYETVMLFPH